MTLFSGSPESFSATVVKISTGFATIKRTPLNSLFLISGIIDLNIEIFFLTKSSLVSPGF